MVIFMDFMDIMNLLIGYKRVVKMTLVPPYGKNATVRLCAILIIFQF